MLAPTRRNHDLTYACFLPLGLMGLAASVATFVPMDSGTAGSIGLLLLVPLALAALITTPIGVYRTALGFRGDPWLWGLSACSLLMVVQLFLELGPPRVRDIAWLAYGVLVIVALGAWFLVRRRRAYP